MRLIKFNDKLSELLLLHQEMKIEKVMEMHPATCTFDRSLMKFRIVEILSLRNVLVHLLLLAKRAVAFFGIRPIIKIQILRESNHLSGQENEINQVP